MSRRPRGKLDLDPVTVRKARALARKAGRPIVDLAKQHTTVSVERATLRMAGLDGIALSRALREHPHTRALPIALLTALDFDDAVVMRELRIQGCMNKPVRAAVLRQTLAAAMPPSEEQAAQIQPKAIAWQRLPQDLDEVGCMLWDETIGRLFLAGKTGYSVFVLEYAKNPRLGEFTCST